MERKLESKSRSRLELVNQSSLLNYLMKQKIVLLKTSKKDKIEAKKRLKKVEKNNKFKRYSSKAKKN